MTHESFGEYSEVLNRPKFKFNLEHISTLLKEMEVAGQLIVGLPIKDMLPDPDDKMFLEVALAGNAECIITGNTNHFPDKVCPEMQVFSPVKFIEYFKKRQGQ